MMKTINVSPDLLFTMVLRSLRDLGPHTLKGLAKLYGFDGDAWETKNALETAVNAHRTLGAVNKDGVRYVAVTMDQLHASAEREYQDAQFEEIKRAPLSVIRDFVRLRFETSTANDEADSIWSELYEYQRLRIELRSRVNQLKRSLETVEDRLKHDKIYVGINSLGEIQGEGTRVDIACALLSKAEESFIAAITGRASDAYRAQLLEAIRAAAKKPEIHTAFNAKGEEIKVTIPES